MPVSVVSSRAVAGELLTSICLTMTVLRKQNRRNQLRFLFSDVNKRKRKLTCTLQPLSITDVVIKTRFLWEFYSGCLGTHKNTTT